MTATDWNVCEPVNARLKLRDDLICTPRVFNGKPSYVIEDPLRGKFYRVGLPEFTLISLLDGRTSLADALGKAAQRLGRDALDQQEGISICRWLVDAQLAQTAESSKAGRMRRTADDLAKSKLQARLNPFGFQIPLLNPDRLLERALPYTGWLLGPIFAVAWLAALLAGLYCVMADLPHFVSSSGGRLETT